MIALAFTERCLLRVVPHSNSMAAQGAQRVAVLSKIAKLLPALEAEAKATGVPLTFLQLPHDCADAGAWPADAGSCTMLVADPPLLPAAVPLLPALQWVQSTFAGVDGYFKALPAGAAAEGAPAPPTFTFTRLTGGFGPQMAEYVLGHTLALTRQHTATRQAQAQCKWDSASLAVFPELSSLTLGVLGAGTIGREVLRAAQAGFRMHTAAWVRQHKADLPEAEEQFTDLAEFLSHCDVVVNLLPSTPDTVGVLDGAWPDVQGRPGPLFINAGRGDVMAEAQLEAALDSGRIRHAVLDVFPVEPLPAASPLWRRGDVTITPHVAAVSFPSTVAQAFMRNYVAQRDQGLQSLPGQVDWAKRY